MKRILIHDFAGHPFAIQLSRTLAARGHATLHLYAGHNRTPRGNLRQQAHDPPEFQLKGVFTDARFRKYNLVRRYLQEREYARKLIGHVRDFAPDVVLSANTPLDVQSRLWQACARDGIRRVFWLQDLLGVGMRTVLGERLGLLGDVLGQHYERLERSTLAQSDAIVAISPDFKDALGAMGIGGETVTVIENWAPIEELPALPKDNAWAQQHGLAETFVFLYAGTLGLKHDPAMLLALCTAFRDEPAVKVVVASEGPGAQWLAEQQAQHGIENLLLLPFQPYDALPGMLAASDVLLIQLNARAGDFAVPSKLYTSLCAGRAILAALPAGNLARRLMAEHELGLHVDADDRDGFVAAAQRLHGNTELREQLANNAIYYANSTFDASYVAERFAPLLFPTTR